MNEFYTDGACSGNPGYGGWAVLDCQTGEVHAGEHYPATNNQMELYAIYEAAVLMDVDSDNQIYTDSRMCINWMVKRYSCTKPHLKPIREAMDYLMLHNKLRIHFVKVKGHSHDHYNNMVDKAAAKAAKALRREHELNKRQSRK